MCTPLVFITKRKASLLFHRPYFSHSPHQRWIFKRMLMDVEADIPHSLDSTDILEIVTIVKKMLGRFSFKINSVI